jgi:hypothetical protein
MKKFLQMSFLSLFIFLSFSRVIQAQEVLDIEALTEEITAAASRECNFAVQQISQFDINPFIITEPGLYCLNSNVQVTPTQGIGIIINANNVIIDLNQFTIQGSGQVTGILISGNNSIIIRNGTMSNFGGTGIFFNPVSVITPTTGIIIDSINFLNNYTNVNMTAQNCAITNCYSYSAIAPAFIINQSVNIVLQNCISMGPTNGVGSIALASSTSTAFNITQSINVLLRNCVANYNMRGFFFNINTYLTAVGCIANDNVNEGFNQTGGSEHIFQDCTSNDNGLSGFIITNQSTTSPSLLTIIKDCYAQFNTAQGFNINGNQHSLISCFADDNGINGFLINGNNHTILNCEAKNNTKIGFSLAAASTGAIAATNCHVRNNLAIGNSTGFSNAGVGNRIYANYANNNFTGVILNDFVGITNVAVSPTPATPINFTTNISE